MITKVSKFFTKQYSVVSEINEDEEAQRRYKIAKEGWKKVRKHYFAFLFLKYFGKKTMKLKKKFFIGKKMFLWDLILPKKKNLSATKVL